MNKNTHPLTRAQELAHEENSRLRIELKSLQASVEELVKAAKFANDALAVGGAPTRGQCQEMRERFAAALAKFGGGA